MEPKGGRQEAPDVRLAEGGLRRVRGVAVREGHARAGALRQRLRDGGLPEDPPPFRRLPDAPELPDQEGVPGGLGVKGWKAEWCGPILSSDREDVIILREL